MAKEITYDEYEKLKKEAYQLSAEICRPEVSYDEFISRIKQEMRKYNKKDARKIFASTVAFPEDMLIYTAVKEGKVNSNLKTLNWLEQEFGWPNDVAIAKHYEVNFCGLVKLLDENPELRPLADRESYFKMHNAKKR